MDCFCLPLVPLFKIFNYLPINDQEAVSEVNLYLYTAYNQFKAQRQGDYQAIKQYTVSYHSRIPVEVQLEHLLCHVGRDTELIKQLSIKFDLAKGDTCKHHAALCITLRKVCQLINQRNSDIVVLSIECLRLFYMNGSCESWCLVQALMKMLKKQQSLFSVSLRDMFLTSRDASMLMFALTRGSCSSLRRLDIVNVIDVKPGTENGVRHAWMPTFLPRLKGLKKLSLNFEYLTPPLLANLSRECYCLEIITIELFKTSTRHSNLTRDMWTAAMRKNHCLCVYVTIQDLGIDLATFEPHLPRNIVIR